MIICKVCGEKINYDAKFCPECGATLKSNIEIKSKNEVEKRSGAISLENNKNNSSGKNKKLKSQNDSVKIISSKYLLYFISFLFVSGVIIIYSSGIFENPTSAASSESNKNDPHAGVDLNNLEQINSYEAALKNNPGDKETLLNLAHLLNDSGLKAKAIERYNDYLKLDPKNSDVLVDMGVCYYETGKNDEAIKAMEKALKFQPRHQIAHLNLGIVNMTAGNSAKAVEWWKKAIEIDPTNEIGKKAEELIKTH